MSRFPPEGLAPVVGRLLAGVSAVSLPTADAEADCQAGQADDQVNQNPDEKKVIKGYSKKSPGRIFSIESSSTLKFDQSHQSRDHFKAL